MDDFSFIIVGIVILKLIFWTCYFTVRAQRIREIQNSRRVIVVPAGTVVRRTVVVNDRSAIMNHAAPIAVTGPPPYSQVPKGGQAPCPPPYSQAAPSAPASGYPPQQGAPPPYLGPQTGGHPV